ncbi:hypothetical protein LX77_02082 [Gelidibacter algens]|uniref:Uncharacterized protein n=1 Tax=Gelidibacter algens TaxID=49280 RepID=A0A327S6W3_9FLAO|nr:hypothetical protein LX77_02082 [Gelidibacter algens]
MKSSAENELILSGLKTSRIFSFLLFKLFVISRMHSGITANDLNMVRLAFQRSKFSVYYFVYLLLSSSYLALSAKCTIFFVSLSNFYFLIYLLNSEFSISFSSFSFPSLVSVNKNPNAGYLLKSNFLTTNTFSKSCFSASKSK